MGHRVSTPTQTGVGERKHLLSKNITLDTFTADIINHIEAETMVAVVARHAEKKRAFQPRRTRASD